MPSEISNILVTYALAAVALIGLVNGFRLAAKRDWKGFTLFLLAVMSGLVFGYLRWFSLPDVETGFLVGLASSGAYRLTQDK